MDPAALDRAESVLNDLLGFSYLTKHELDFLRAIADRTPENAVLINIGAGVGTSGLGLLLTRPNGSVITVDFAGDENPYGGLRNEMIALERAGISLEAPRYAQMLGDSREAALRWGGGEVDLVFVDDGHEFAETEGDILLWGAFIKPGGFILVHDYEKAKYFLAKHPEADADRVDREGKPFPGLDEAVRLHLLDQPSQWKYAGTVDTLIAFQKIA